jgi:hypothetical protein
LVDATDPESFLHRDDGDALRAPVTLAVGGTSQVTVPIPRGDQSVRGQRSGRQGIEGSALSPDEGVDVARDSRHELPLRMLEDRIGALVEELLDRGTIVVRQRRGCLLRGRRRADQ